MFSHKKVLISVLGVGMAAMVAVPVASAATHSLPAGTTVEVALKSGTKLVIKGTIDGAAITVTCTKVAGSGKVPSGKPTTLPIGACRRSPGAAYSLGGTDTVTTKGTWTLTENSATAMTVTIPKAGADVQVEHPLELRGHRRTGEGRSHQGHIRRPQHGEVHERRHSDQGFRLHEHDRQGQHDDRSQPGPRSTTVLNTTQ